MQGWAGGKKTVIQEASGIARLGDKLLIVGDDADGRYFEMDLEGRVGPVIPIVQEKVKEIVMPHADMAMDLESIDILADGRIAVLSEQLRCLVARERVESDRYTVIAEYGRTLSEFGNLGLEGLAVERLDDGSSKVAVLWEGGYPIIGAVNPQLREKVGRGPLKPIVAIHPIEAPGTVEAEESPHTYITLDVPLPDGEAPDAQRFRGSDLVWHRWRDPEAEDGVMDGFIVLLTSSNSSPEGSDTPRRYLFKLLQRFDLEGRPVGDPLDLKKICQMSLGESADAICKGLGAAVTAHMTDVMGIIRESEGESVNWEGLSWFEEGKSLITIYDTWPKDPPFALVFEIPPEWK
jgi:hypothetical protein